MSEHRGAIVDRLFAALSGGDVEGALDCLTADAQVWHSFDCISQDRQAVRAGWEALVANFPERHFTDARRHAIPDGFVQQHLMTARTASGKLMAWPICMVFRLEGERIGRIEEYIDRAGSFEPDSLIGCPTPGLD